MVVFADGREAFPCYTMLYTAGRGPWMSEYAWQPSGIQRAS